MKRLPILLISITLPFAATTIAGSASSEEDVLVVHQQNVRPVDDLEVDCVWASQLGVIATGGYKSDLYSVQSKKTSGSLLNNDIKKVGALLGCFDDGSPQVERGSTPTYDLGHVWLITLNGQQYVVTGMSRLRTIPGVDTILDEPGNFLGVSTGTVFTPETLVMNPPVPVGSYSSNFLSNVFFNPTGGTEAIITLRLYSQN